MKFLMGIFNILVYYISGVLINERIMLQRQVIFVQLNDGSYLLKVTLGGKNGID